MCGELVTTTCAACARTFAFDLVSLPFGRPQPFVIHQKQLARNPSRCTCLPGPLKIMAGTVEGGRKAAQTRARRARRGRGALRGGRRPRPRAASMPVGPRGGPRRRRGAGSMPGVRRAGPRRRPEAGGRAARSRRPGRRRAPEWREPSLVVLGIRPTLPEHMCPRARQVSLLARCTSAVAPRYRTSAAPLPKGRLEG